MKTAALLLLLGQYWTLNPGAEHSQVVSSGALLGAGKFRVAAQTHLDVNARLQLREHVTGAFAPIDRLQILAQLPFALLEGPEQGIGRPWAGVRVGLLSPQWDDAMWLAVEGHVGIPGLEPLNVIDRLIPSGLAKVSVGLPMGTRAAFGAELNTRFGLQHVVVGAGATLSGMGIHFGGEFTVQGNVSLLNRTTGFIEALGGFRYRLRPLELSLLGGPGVQLNPSTISGRIVFGIAFVNPGEPEGAIEERTKKKADCTDGTAYRLEDCPDLDWDSDGVLNGLDRCPREPGVKENDGCPWVDTDGDDVADAFDNCPRVRGPANNAGCPEDEPQRVLIKKDRLEILEVIYFEFDKAVIKGESFELLEQVAKVINAHPELAHLRIEGHTDRVGGAEYNRQLSLARANAVKSFLIELGHVAGERLSTRGYGFDRPLGDDDAQNRRVEFLIITAPDESAMDPAP